MERILWKEYCGKNIVERILWKWCLRVESLSVAVGTEGAVSRLRTTFCNREWMEICSPHKRLLGINTSSIFLP